ncbi:hypothetical protein B0H14DRAFT_2588844 [Mycena olivaceomarginata]|nr:hypothetical protein B0H14DRAFT_2588844 [Mycena olivaceomarginata]
MAQPPVERDPLSISCIGDVKRNVGVHLALPGRILISTNKPNFRNFVVCSGVRVAGNHECEFEIMKANVLLTDPTNTKINFNFNQKYLFPFLKSKIIGSNKYSLNAIKVTRFHLNKRSNKVTKKATTPKLD